MGQNKQNILWKSSYDNQRTQTLTFFSRKVSYYIYGAHHFYISLCVNLMTNGSKLMNAGVHIKYGLEGLVLFS